jgi:hypothetical protein
MGYDGVWCLEPIDIFEERHLHCMSDSKRFSYLLHQKIQPFIRKNEKVRLIVINDDDRIIFSEDIHTRNQYDRVKLDICELASINFIINAKQSCQLQIRGYETMRTARHTTNLYIRRVSIAHLCKPGNGSIKSIIGVLANFMEREYFVSYDEHEDIVRVFDSEETIKEYVRTWVDVVDGGQEEDSFEVRSCTCFEYDDANDPMVFDKEWFLHEALEHGLLFQNSCTYYNGGHLFIVKRAVSADVNICRWCEELLRRLHRT